MERTSSIGSETEWIQMLDQTNEMERRARMQLQFILEMKEVLLKSHDGFLNQNDPLHCSRV